MIDLGSYLLPLDLVRRSSPSSELNDDGFPSALRDRDDVAELAVFFGGSLESPDWELL